MKYIISETQNNYLKRRVMLINNLVKKALKKVDPEDYNYHDYVEEIAWSVWDSMSESEQGTDKDNMEEFFDYVRDNYWKEIETYYLENT